MSTVTRKMTKGEIDALYKKLKPFSVRETCPAWSHWQLKTEDMTVTAYTSGKVVFQGDVEWMEEKKPVSGPVSVCMAGSDEAGTGDFFGPVTCAAVLVDENSLPVLKELGVTDSKAMKDEDILKAAPRIKEVCPHSVLVLSNDKYNQVHARMNLNAIKAMLHNQCYVNLQKKGHALPSLCVVDQFCAPDSYYRHLRENRADPVISTLHFETKAESKYPAVAAASVLARAAFLEAMDALEEKWGMEFQKGAGPAADKCGRKFISMHGMENLPHVAKMHFKNVEKI